MNSQKEYWDKKISEWTKASYGKNDTVNPIEKIAAYFRSVQKRKDAAIKLVGPIAKNKIVLDLGCGLGEFSFGLMKYKPRKIIAFDISHVAVSQVKKTAQKLRFGRTLEAKVSDITSLKKLPRFDIVVGLGFLDYLKPMQLSHLFSMIGNKSYLFSFFERKRTFFNLLHKVYTTIQRCPGAYKYTRKQMRNFIPKQTKLRFINKDHLWFVTNLI